MATGLQIRIADANFTKNLGAVIGHDIAAFQSTFYRGIDGVMALDNYGATAPVFVGSGATFGSSGIQLSTTSGFNTGVTLDQPFTMMIVGELPTTLGGNTHMTSFVGAAGYNGFLTVDGGVQSFSLRRPGFPEARFSMPLTRSGFAFYAASNLADGTLILYAGNGTSLQKTVIAASGTFAADVNTIKLNVVGASASDFSGAKAMSVVATAMYKGTPLTDDQVSARYQAYKRMFDSSLPNPL